MSIRQQLLVWSDELRAIANDGLRWATDNPYNQHRFARVRRIAAELFAAQDVRDADTIEQVFSAELTHIAPYPGGDAAIFNESGQMLLIQRNDNQLWAMPGGLLDVGETPAEGTCREALEETGVAVEAVALIGVYDSRRSGSQTTAHLYQFVFLCRPLESHPQPVVTNETLAVGWFAENDLPPLSPGHVNRIPEAFRFWGGELRQTVFI
jgi:ADP-ribose pyrophosphatase YjhB (NUDIX family)